MEKYWEHIAINWEHIGHTYETQWFFWEHIGHIWEHYGKHIVNNGNVTHEGTWWGSRRMTSCTSSTWPQLGLGQPEMISHQNSTETSTTCLHPEGGPSPCTPTDLEKRVEPNEWIGLIFWQEKCTKTHGKPMGFTCFYPQIWGSLSEFPFNQCSDPDGHNNNMNRTWSGSATSWKPKSPCITWPILDTLHSDYYRIYYNIHPRVSQTTKVPNYPSKVYPDQAFIAGSRN